MRAKDKIHLDFQGLIEHGPLNIVAFGDSVTHGCVGPGEYDYESVYWNRLKRMITAVNPSTHMYTTNDSTSSRFFRTGLSNTIRRVVK